MAEWIEGKVCLVTGATQGIGLAAARALAQKGAQVVLVARDPTRGQAALEQVRTVATGKPPELLLADLSSMAQVRKLAADFKAGHSRLHVLLNNAGAIFTERQVTVDGFERTFALDHLAYFLLTRELRDVLVASAPARVINVASDAHLGGRMRFDDPMMEKGFGGTQAYMQAKLANILFTRELARRLAGTGVTANALHPGGVASGFAQDAKGWFKWVWTLATPFLLTPEKGARTSIFLASDPSVAEVSGKYFARRRPRRPSPAARNDEDARRLWELSERLLEPAAKAVGAERSA
jgi:NAD(P)-dependent dehydrogenase (short-subunit alcohol dehydrogenase family)